jgi:acyl-CoA dehydrogenase
MRERLTAGIYTTPNSNNVVGFVGEVLQKVILAEKIEKKIQEAVQAKIISPKNIMDRIGQAVAAGVITTAEKIFLEETEAARREVSAVDDFK